MFPKVLIIGHTFNQKNGAGITLTNLFKDWPKDRLAVASLSYPPDTNDCTIRYENHYVLGKNEARYIWPLNYFSKIGPSVKTTVVSTNLKAKINNRKNAIYNFLQWIIRKSGLQICRLKFNISTDLKEWIHEFNPDIIYSALGDLSFTQFLYLIKTNLKYPLTIHIWDDWPNSLTNNTVLKPFLKPLLDKAFTRLLLVSDLNLCISEKMAIAYENRYHRAFIPFHNPVDITYWDSVPKSRSNKDIIKCNIVYIGKINKDTDKSLLLISKAVQNFRIEHPDFVFDIYTPDINHKIISRFVEGTNVHKSIDHKDVVHILKNACILFLPLNFSKVSIKYTRFSMPTKVSEYMYSETPTIVFAPPEIALSEYAKKYEWAYIVDYESQNDIYRAIVKVLENPDLQETLVQNAKNLVKLHHSSEIVQKKFRETLTSIL